MAESDPPMIRFEDDPVYWQALGEFVEGFASIEAMLALTLSQYAGIRPLIGRAVFSGLRPDTAMSQVRRIMEISDRGEGAREEIEHIFAQVAILNDARNQVVHYPSFIIEGFGRVVSNASRSHVPRTLRELRVSPDILRDMSADLRVISVLLVNHAFRDQLSKEERASFDAELARPWRYKPPAQSHGPKPSKERSGRQKRPERPPPASPE